MSLSQSAPFLLYKMIRVITSRFVQSTVMTVTLAAIGSALPGCSEQVDESFHESASVPDFPESLSGLTQAYLSIEYVPKFSDLYLYDYYEFYRLHRTEMSKTRRLRDSIVTTNVAIVFYQYQIDSMTFKDVLWFRKVESRWRVCLSQYFSEYSDDPFNDGLPDGAREIIKRAAAWKKGNKGMWWE